LRDAAYVPAAFNVIAGPERATRLLALAAVRHLAPATWLLGVERKQILDARR
jgi:hypothetical protein